MATLEDIENRFSFHPANTVDRQQFHGWVRTRCESLATYLNDAIPPGREQALALTKLEEVMFWANAAVARAPEDVTE